MIKTKMSNAARHAFLGSIMKKSGNYLPLTNREKAMILWFAKFTTATIFLTLCWTVPTKTIIGHFESVSAMEYELSQIKEKKQEEAILDDLSVSQPQAAEKEQIFDLVDEFTGTVYAYNSFESQTDGDPCTGAYGYICDKKNVVANNCYLPGTIVEIGGKKYEVFDKMNKRYGCDVFDVYMGMDHQAALDFGKKITNVKILRFKKQ